MPVLGLDPAFFSAKSQRPSTAAILENDLSVLELATPITDEEILALAQKYRPLVAIDAPLTLPRGLDCLEETHPCQPEDIRPGRAAERELAKLGMGLFFTTKRSIIKQLVFRAICLKDALTQMGLEVIEVYPYATRLRLFGPLPKKTTVAGRQAIQKSLRKLIPWLPDPNKELLSHDLLDACLCAYTAYLWSHSQTLTLGDPQEGLIFIPV